MSGPRFLFGKRAQVARRLSELASREGGAPPADLLERLRADIPPRLAIPGTNASKIDSSSSAGQDQDESRTTTDGPRRWLVAASLAGALAATLVGLAVHERMAPSRSESIAAAARPSAEPGAPGGTPAGGEAVGLTKGEAATARGEAAADRGVAGARPAAPKPVAGVDTGIASGRLDATQDAKASRPTALSGGVARDSVAAQPVMPLRGDGGRTARPGARAAGKDWAAQPIMVPDRPSPAPPVSAPAPPAAASAPGGAPAPPAEQFFAPPPPPPLPAAKSRARNEPSGSQGAPNPHGAASAQAATNAPGAALDQAVAKLQRQTKSASEANGSGSTASSMKEEDLVVMAESRASGGPAPASPSAAAAGLRRAPGMRSGLIGTGSTASYFAVRRQLFSEGRLPHSGLRVEELANAFEQLPLTETRRAARPVPGQQENGFAAPVPAAGAPTAAAGAPATDATAPATAGTAAAVAGASEAPGGAPATAAMAPAFGRRGASSDAPAARAAPAGAAAGRAESPGEPAGFAASPAGEPAASGGDAARATASGWVGAVRASAYGAVRTGLPNAYWLQVAVGGSTAPGRADAVEVAFDPAMVASFRRVAAVGQGGTAAALFEIELTRAAAAARAAGADPVVATVQRAADAALTAVATPPSSARAAALPLRLSLLRHPFAAASPALRLPALAARFGEALEGPAPPGLWRDLRRDAQALARERPEDPQVVDLLGLIDRAAQLAGVGAGAAGAPRPPGSR